jgi:hypothetical protein
LLGEEKKMRKGRIMIDYDSNESGDCKFKIHQDGVDHLDNDNLISLFEHIIGDLIQDQF